MRYYIYKCNNEDCRNISFLGIFETNINMLKLFDVLVNIFGEGFFYRRKPINDIGQVENNVTTSLLDFEEI